MRHASDGCERILVSVTDAAAVIGRAIAEFIRAWAANVFVQYEIATAIGFPMTDPASFLTPCSTTGRWRDIESAGLARVGVSRFPVARKYATRARWQWSNEADLRHGIVLTERSSDAGFDEA